MENLPMSHSYLARRLVLPKHYQIRSHCLEEGRKLGKDKRGSRYT